MNSFALIIFGITGNLAQIRLIPALYDMKEKVFQKLCQRLKYLSGDLTDQKLYEKLRDQLKNKNSIFYLATYPELYHYVFENLKKFGLNKQSNGWVKLMIEKP